VCNVKILCDNSCARGDTICPRPLYTGRCGPAAAHPLHLYVAQPALLLIAVGTMNINELMNINDRVRHKKVVSESRGLYLCANFGHMPH